MVGTISEESAKNMHVVKRTFMNLPTSLEEPMKVMDSYKEQISNITVQQARLRRKKCDLKKKLRDLEKAYPELVFKE